MSSRASGGALAASLIIAAIVGFGGGAYIGTQTGASTSDGGDASADDNTGASTPGGEPSTGDGGETNGETSGEVGVSLESEETSVEPAGRINLSGALTPPVAGVELKVQRSIDGGEWEDFPNADSPITFTTNEDGRFDGWISSSREGVNGIRVVRTDDDSVASEPVEVTIG